MDFHDSIIREIRVGFSCPDQRVCLLDIDYYNWEENECGKEWKWKRLKIHFGYLAALEFSAPDMINCAHEIDHLITGEDLDELKIESDRVKRSFPKARIPLFDSDSEPVSLKFMTENGAEMKEGYKEGYVKIIGSEVILEWVENDTLIGKTHIPIDE